MPGILIADTDRDLCELYQQFFSHHGWQVRTSGDGLDCLGQLRHYTPQLLILDTHLPWGGADGLLAVMREDPALTRVPVILTATEDAPEIVSGMMAAPIVQVLWKPFSLAALVERVASEVEKREPKGTKERRDLDSPHRCS